MSFCRAQGSIEYLLIIGAAILVVVIVIASVSGVLTSGGTQGAHSGDLFSGEFNQLRGNVNTDQGNASVSQHVSPTLLLNGAGGFDAITQSGMYSLSDDLSSDKPLVILARDVTINGGGHKLDADIDASDFGVALDDVTVTGSVDAGDGGVVELKGDSDIGGVNEGAVVMLGGSGAMVGMASSGSSSCSVVISSPATYVLSNDMTGAGQCVEILSDNVVFDGNGHTITGSGGGEGVSSSSHSNITVRNLNVRSFNYGIKFTSVSGSSITNVNSSSNRGNGGYNKPSYDGAGVFVSGSNNTITNSVANSNTGGHSCAYDDCMDQGGGNSYGFYVQGNNNLVSGCVASGNVCGVGSNYGYGAGGEADGIYLSGNGNVIRDSNFSNNTCNSQIGGRAAGIHLFSASSSQLMNNRVMNNLSLGGNPIDPAFGLGLFMESSNDFNLMNNVACGNSQADFYCYTSRAASGSLNIFGQRNVTPCQSWPALGTGYYDCNVHSGINNGLVGYWRFDETSSTSAADSSGNANTGTLVNGPVWAAGKSGNALSFDGSNDRVDVADAASLHLTTAMTLAAWVNPSVMNSTWRDLIEKGNDDYYLMGTSQPSGYPAGGSTIIPNLYGAAPLPTNTWSHLAFTYDGSMVRLYVNGVQVGSRAQTGNLAISTNPLGIGGDVHYGQYFSGLIDDARVYNRALSASEVQYLYSMPPPVSNYILTVANSGGGSITSSPSGINCGSTCSANYTSGTSVTLTATPNSGYTFNGWGGACSGTGACTVTMNSNQNASATFSSGGLTYSLTVANSGGGTVISNSGEINCGSTCFANYTSGTIVALTAAPDVNHTFSAWGGACTEMGACDVNVNAAKNVTATFPANIGPPFAPSSLTATAISSSQIALSWLDNASNETSYKVEYSIDNSYWYILKAGLGANTTSYTEANLSGGATYYYRVRAVNAGGESAVSNTAYATTLPGPIGIPNNLVVTPLADRYLLSWDNVPGAVFYRIHYAWNPNDNFYLIGWFPTSSPFTFPVVGYVGVPPNYTLYFELSSVDALGNESERTPYVGATTPVPYTPLAPTGLQAVALSSRIALSWKTPAGPTSYSVYRSTDGNNFSLAANLLSGNFFSDTNVLPNRTYYYKVSATAYINESPKSSPLAVTTLPTTTTGTPVNSCQSLNSGTYYLTQDLNTIAQNTNCLTIVGNNVTVNGNGHTIYGQSGFMGSCVEEDGYSNANMSNLYLSGCSHAVTLSHNASNNNYSNIIAQNTWWAAFIVQIYSSYNNFSRIVSTGAESDGFYLSYYSNHNTLADSLLVGNHDGLYLFESSYNTIRNNIMSGNTYMYSNTSAGMWLDSLGSASSTTLTNNYSCGNVVETISVDVYCTADVTGGMNASGNAYDENRSCASWLDNNKQPCS